MKHTSFIALLSLFACLGVAGASDDSCNTTTCTSKQTCFNGNCLCSDGYVALADTPSNFCSDRDECANEEDNCDSTNGYCVDHDPPVKFQCGCLPGYACDLPEGSCTSCSIDLTHVCNIDGGGCGGNATCTPFPNNSSKCDCDDGFSGDGISCTPVADGPTSSPTAAPSTTDSCATKDCDNATSTCEMVSGSPICSCNSGFQATSTGTCLDVDECLGISTNECTIDRSICVNLPGSHRCQCETGFLDFPGSIAGTDCRTEEEIEIALSVGAVYEVTTGLSGISLEDFGEGSAAREALKEYYAERFNLNTTDISFGNVTEIDTTLSRRMLEGERSLQGDDESSVSFRIFFRVRKRSLRRAGSNNYQRLVALAAAVDEVFDDLSDFFLRLDTDEGDEAAAYLQDVGDRFINALVNVNLDRLLRTPTRAITFVTSTIKLNEVTVQQAIDLGTDENNIDGLLLNFFQNQGFSGTPTATPSGLRRSLNEDEEEEDFFGDYAMAACKCIDCDPLSGCEDLWKGRDTALVTDAIGATHVVLSHCDNGLDWLNGFLEGIEIASITIISRCGKVPVDPPAGATVIAMNSPDDHHSFLSWIVVHYDEAMAGTALFLDDQPPSSSAIHLVRMADANDFGCGDVPTPASPSVSVSAYCRAQQFKRSPFWDKAGIDTILGDQELLQVCRSTSFGTRWQAIRKHGKIVWDQLLQTVVMGGPGGRPMLDLWAGLLAKSLTPEEQESVLAYATGEIDGCLSHHSTPDSQSDTYSSYDATASAVAGGVVTSRSRFSQAFRSLLHLS